MDFGELLNNFAATAGNIYGTINAKPSTVVAQTTPAATAPTWQKYLPLGIGAVVLIIVLALVTRKG